MKQVEPQIDLDIDAYLPSSYIQDSMQKIEMYKKFANIRSLEAAFELEEELVDRFGDIPQPTQNLLTIARMKAYAYQYHIESITQKGMEVSIRVSPDQNLVIDGYRLYQIANDFNHRIKLSSGHHIGIKLSTKNLTQEQWLSLMENFLKRYQESLKTEGALT